MASGYSPMYEYAGKLLQLLKEAAPRLRSVAVFVNSSNEASAALVKQMRADVTVAKVPSRRMNAGTRR